MRRRRCCSFWTSAGARSSATGDHPPAHEDAFDLPEGAELLFAGDTVANQAFRYGTDAYGVQFHFEVTAQIIAR